MKVISGLFTCHRAIARYSLGGFFAFLPSSILDIISQDSAEML